MEFGPFNQGHLDEIIPVLKKNGIEYTTRLDEDLLQHKVDEHKNRVTPYPTAALDISAYFLDVAETDLPKLGNTLEAYGMTTAVLFGAPEPTDEYFCSECDFTVEKPGTCPSHGKALILFDGTYHPRQKFLKIAAWMLVAFLIVVIAAQFWT